MTERYDVVIVGTGPTGAAYARILSERAPSLRVAAFEVGPLLADPPGIHVKNILDDAERESAQRASQGPDLGAVASGKLTDYASIENRLVRPGTFLLAEGYRAEGEDGLPAAAMSSNVGGMGAHWTCACPRPGDSEVIDFVDDLDELLSEGERLLGVHPDAFPDAPMAADVRRLLGDALDEGRAPDRRVAPMPLAVHVDERGRAHWSGSDVVFGSPSRSNPRFTLVPETLVTRILVEDRRAVGVRVRDQQSGDEREVAAARVVVAADALRTPQLLWASGIRPEALGRYLNDQPQVVFAARLRASVTGAIDGAEDPAEAGAITANSGVNWVPFTDEHPFHGQVMQLDASPVKLADDDVPEPGSIVGLGWFCAKDLQASDRVDFDDSATDVYGMPAMRIHYTLTDRDRDTLAAAEKAVRRAADAVGDPLGEAPFMLSPGASLHYQGTVRMGATDDGTSVCDANSEVWGVAGLHVAGNGVIPTATACNPTLTSVALAVRGARHIAATLAPTD